MPDDLCGVKFCFQILVTFNLLFFSAGRFSPFHYYFFLVRLQGNFLDYTAHILPAFLSSTFTKFIVRPQWLVLRELGSAISESKEESISEYLRYFTSQVYLRKLAFLWAESYVLLFHERPNFYEIFVALQEA